MLADVERRINFAQLQLRALVLVQVDALARRRDARAGLSGGAEQQKYSPSIKPFDEQFPCLDRRDLVPLEALQHTSRHETL